MSRATHPGLLIAAHKQLSRDVAIKALPAPDELALPLNQHSDGELLPCVSVGASVFKGQVIAKPALVDESSLSAWLHAPVSGSVTAIEPRAVPHSNDSTALSIVISNDHRDAIDTTAPPPADWLQLEPLALCQWLARGGIAGLGGAVFPTATKLAAHAQHRIEYLVINGVECEPFITCDDRLMRERASDIVSGIKILLHAAQASQCIVAIENDKPEALSAMQAALANADADADANDARITIRSIATAYPSGDEGQLITQLVAREIPRWKLPADIGVIMQNVATAYACARWMEQGEPLISRIVTVTGLNVKQPANVEVRLGTPISEVVAACGGYANKITDSTANHSPITNDDTLIMGGAMMGRALPHDQLPIVKASNCLIATPHAALRPAAVEMPCIRCAECAYACPVYLLPQRLLTAALSNNRVALDELGLADCIECGCCDYVCPSNITLAARFHAAKHQAEQ